MPLKSFMWTGRNNCDKKGFQARNIANRCEERKKQTARIIRGIILGFVFNFLENKYDWSSRKYTIYEKNGREEKRLRESLISSMMLKDGAAINFGSK